MDNRLLNLILIFAPLSALSFGGGQAIMADIQNQTVTLHHWFSSQQFSDMFAISRAAPGPNTLIASLIGWQSSGFVGAVVATLAMYIPSSTIFVAVTSLWHKHQGARWRRAIERGLAPIAVGLIFAGALTILQALHVTILGWTTVLVSCGMLYFTKLNPYLLMFSVLVVYTAVYFTT